MIFHDVLEKALGSPIKIRLLKYLFSEGVPTSERELSRILKVSHMTVNRAMRDFEELSLVTKVRIGGAAVWRLKSDSYLYNPLRSLLLYPDPLESLKSRIPEKLKELERRLSIRIREAFLYGSVAEGKEQTNSDVDVFIVVNKRKEELVKNLTGLEDEVLLGFGNRLSIQILTEKQYLNPNKQERIIIEKAEKGVRWM